MTSENVVEAWRESAQYWAKHSDMIRTMFMPLTRALVEHAGIHEGQSVLDARASHELPGGRSPALNSEVRSS